VITFKDTAKSRGFGFVTFATPEAAANAVTQLHGATVGGRALSVAISEPREPRFPRALPGSDAGARGSGQRAALLTAGADCLTQAGAGAGYPQRAFPRQLGSWGVPMPGRSCLLQGASQTQSASQGVPDVCFCCAGAHQPAAACMQLRACSSAAAAHAPAARVARFVLGVLRRA
jgi:RNA recognition motif-containing protein